MLARRGASVIQLMEATEIFPRERGEEITGGARTPPRFAPPPSPLSTRPPPHLRAEGGRRGKAGGRGAARPHCGPRTPPPPAPFPTSDERRGGAGGWWGSGAPGLPLSREAGGAEVLGGKAGPAGKGGGGPPALRPSPASPRLPPFCLALPPHTFPLPPCPLPPRPRSSEAPRPPTLNGRTGGRRQSVASWQHTRKFRDAHTREPRQMWGRLDCTGQYRATFS